MSRNQKGKYEKGGKKKRTHYDSEYIAYCKHGDSAAVFIMRDIQNKVNVEWKWIDVTKKKIRWSDKNWHDFEFFEVELFPVKVHPVYTEFMTDDEKKYETWQTARNDIFQQRLKGYHGRKYRVYPYIDVSYAYKERTRIIDMTLEMFDPETNEWVDCGHGPVPKGYKYRRKIIESETVREPIEIRQYKIRKIERIK